MASPTQNDVAPTVKLDLLQSTQGFGISVIAADRAVRRARVTGLVNNNSILGVAANAIYQAAGGFHHTNLSLPLKRIEVTRAGATSVWGRLVYQHGRIFVLDRDASLQARYRTVQVPFRWYTQPFDVDGQHKFQEVDLNTGKFGLPKSDGYPSGEFDGFDEDDTGKRRPRPWSWQVAAQQIIIPTELPEPPPASLWSLVNRTNEGPITLNGTLYGHNQMRFDGVSVNWEEKFNSSNYPTYYVFTAVPLRQGWLQQFVRRGIQLVGSPPIAVPTWFVRMGRKYRTTNFIDAFPTHDGFAL